jgi:hypothetical protein
MLTYADALQVEQIISANDAKIKEIAKVYRYAQVL